MITIEEPRRSAAIRQGEIVFGAMPERMICEPRAKRPQHAFMSDPPERDNGPGPPDTDGLHEEGSARVDFSRGWFVLGRHAAHRVGDATANQPQRIVWPLIVDARRQAKFKQGRVEQVAGSIPRERAPRPVGPAQTGRKPHDEERAVRRPP